jgi:hypothetical protein
MLLGSNGSISQKLKAGETELTQAERIGAWVDRDIEWLDQLVRLQAVLPGTDRFFVKDFQFSTVQKNGTGIIQLDGYAKSTADIEQVARLLVEAGYGVEPYRPTITPSSAAPEYTVKVTLKLSLPEIQDDPAS